MVVQIKKVGEAVAKRAVGAAVAATGGKPPLAKTQPEVLQPLRPPRALTAEEAPLYAPHRESTTHSMTPWIGWFQRWLKETIGPERFEKFRYTFFFAPDDIYDLHQSPRMSKPIPISKTDPTITHMYRTPSPGSQIPARQPEFEANEDPYDVGYFKRDTRRRYLGTEGGDPEVEALKIKLLRTPENSELIDEELAKLEAGPESSPGNKGVFATGPSSFDPTGLRATMSVNWKSLNASLDSHMPDHLPTATWEGHEEEIIAWHEARNLPVPVGQYYAPLKVPLERRVARW